MLVGDGGPMADAAFLEHLGLRHVCVTPMVEVVEEETKSRVDCDLELS